MRMAELTRELIDEAKAVNLYDYLLSHYPSDVEKAGDSLKLKFNHSVSVKRGTNCGYDFATGQGYNTINFLDEFFGIPFPKSVFALLNGKTVPVSQGTKAEVVEEKGGFDPPPKVQGKSPNLFAYLCNRGISAETIGSLMKLGILYQSDKAHSNNIVFLNKERDFGEIRESNSFKKFKQTIGNSRADGYWSFTVGGKEEPDIVFICESAIDAISLYELQREDIKKLGKTVKFASTGGAGKQQAIDRLKREHPDICVLACDNPDIDPAGKKCCEKNPDLKLLKPQGKDWNADLVNLRKRGKAYD